MISRRRHRNISVGADEPRTPTHSLPSYDEPTAETNRKLTREEEAEVALLNTSFAPAARTVLIAFFLLTIATVPALQFMGEIRSHGATRHLPMFDVYKLAPTMTHIASLRHISDLRHLLPSAEDIKATEKNLERDSVVSQALLPHVQSFLTGQLGAGNEQVYRGRDGWLFYRPDVEYVTGLPFLDRAHIHARRLARDVEPNSVRTIIDFRDQLAARGIKLVVVPIPVKPQIDGEMLATKRTPETPLQNPAFDEWKQQLTSAGVEVFDPLPLLVARKSESGGAPLYLQTDSHWRPETMEFIAEKLAAVTRVLSPADTVSPPPPTIAKEVSGIGDIAAMLKLPAEKKLFARQRVTVHEAASASGRNSSNGDVLLLGDSFTNIFSLEAMGWGESAGFAEHLSRTLHLDCIVRNSDGAFATREILQHELARGRDRLAGKRVVIWEFATRELSIGNWRLLDMKLGKSEPARFLTINAGDEREITGTVEAVSSVPRAGSVPYKDHIMSLHVVDIDGKPGAEALVYAWSMRDNVWTSAARIRPGDQVKLKLRAWNEVAAQFEKFNRSEIEDPAVQLEEPVWGELVR